MVGESRLCLDNAYVNREVKMANKIKQLHELGQSLWYDNIARDLLDSGAIQALVEDGVRGLTSNPTIFQHAISGGDAYDDQLRELSGQGKATETIYEHMAVEDIRRAADLLRPVYEDSKGEDGYVSLEVSPLLAHDAPATVAEATRLFEWVARPNLMIKVPATAEGLPAIQEAIARGLNINVTLIFSREVYAQVIDAYMIGLERRIEEGKDISRVASVASFFVSRVDTLVDVLLDEMIATASSDAEKTRLAGLKGQAANANAKLAYQIFRQHFDGDRFARLKEQEARVQRPLWASTSTKNPAYDDLLYVNNLIGPQTVNTAPPQTIEAFLDHGIVVVTLEQGLEKAQTVMGALDEVGIDMEVVTDRLLAEGVAKFAESFRQLLDAIEQKCRGDRA